VAPKGFIARVCLAVGIAIPVTVAVALASTDGAELPAAGPHVRVEAMEGPVLESEREGQAALRAAGLEPGDTASGSVLVTNDGGAGGMFWLSGAGVSDRQGPAGGTLSERLQVTVLDVSAPDAPMIVYTGGPTELTARPLGFIGPGRSRIYSVAATLLPDRGRRTAPSPYEGSSTTLSLAWRAIAGKPPAGDVEGRPAVARDTRSPRLRLSIPPTQRLLETGALVVKARCDESCRLRATGRMLAGGAPRAPVLANARLARGEAKQLRLTFGPRARRALRTSLLDGRAVRVELAVSGRDRAGNSARATRPLWLRPTPSP